MQAQVLEVVEDPTLRHSFVLVSKKFFDVSIAPLFSKNPPAAVALRIVGSSSTAFVGCLTTRFHPHSGKKIVFPRSLAMNCEIRDGEAVQCIPMSTLPLATKVLVSPVSVDESEVVEKNALQIEMNLLQQLCVVSPGMPITVFLHSGLTAKVKVCEIECGEGNPIIAGGATMTQGTLFVVATRQRTAAQPSTNMGEEEVLAPTWALLRSHPKKELINAADNASFSVKIHSSTAKKWGWKDGLKLNAIDVAFLPTLQDESISSTFLRSHQILVKVDISDEVPEGFCWSPFPKVTNVMFSPAADDDPRADVLPEYEEDRSEGPSWSDVCAVHGDMPRALLHHLQLSFSHPSMITNGNALVCGGKGYGKSTLVSSVLNELDDVHVVKLKCFPGKDFTNKLHQGMAEAILCAPSVVLLDDFDAVAPEQKEGNNAAMTDATKALLTAVVSRFSRLHSMVERNMVMVVATAVSRDTLNQHFRSATFFPSSWTITALTRKTRQVLLKQCVPSATDEDTRKMVAFMENYCPFDIYRISKRLLNSNETKGNLVEKTERIASSFTPLAHSGISFLKGTKVDWGAIGGLKEAKKVLYDTLVLPIHHPQLFSRLPLKTRSGILLYGPSGSGKTFILESLVKAENLNCLVVNGPEVFGKYIGQSEQKIRDVFERAQAAAPCVVFFDEFDSVAPQRGLDNSGVTDRVVNQLLCYLDGVEGRKDVFVVAASSRPDLIDAALLRPGRLDKAVACPIPSLTDRQEILQNLLSNTQSTVTNADIQQLAEMTNNWTPADLAALVSTANTMACQKVLSTLSSSLGSVVDQSTEHSYCITDIGTSQSLDKMKDSLKILVRSTGVSATQAASKIEVTAQNMMDAFKETRPSLTAKDIKNFERIHALFSKGETPVPKQPGTKLVSS